MRFVLADIRLLMIDVFTYHIKKILTGNIGLNIENFLFKIICSIVRSFIECPNHIAPSRLRKC